MEQWDGDRQVPAGWVLALTPLFPLFFLQGSAASCDPARHAPPAPPRPTAPPASGWAAGHPKSQVRGAQPWGGEPQASHNPRCPQPALTPRLQTNTRRLRSPMDLSNPAQHPWVRGPGCFPQSRCTSPGSTRLHPPALSLWGFGAPSSQPRWVWGSSGNPPRVQGAGASGRRVPRAGRSGWGRSGWSRGPVGKLLLPLSRRDLELRAERGGNTGDVCALQHHRPVPR